jgi:hypothetical protein
MKKTFKQIIHDFAFPCVLQCFRGVSTPPSTPVHSDCELWESSYIEYLMGARATISECVRATAQWTAPYDGENPAPAARHQLQAEKTAAAADLLTDTHTNVGEAKSRSGVEKHASDPFTDAQEDKTVQAGNELVDVSKDGQVEAASSSCLSTCRPPDSALDATTVADGAPIAAAEDCIDSAVAAVPERSRPAGEKAIDGVAAAENLDVFLRQLSHVSAKIEDVVVGTDLFAEFDVLAEQLSKRISVESADGERPPRGINGDADHVDGAATGDVTRENATSPPKLSNSLNNGQTESVEQLCDGLNTTTCGSSAVDVTPVNDASNSREKTSAGKITTTCHEVISSGNQSLYPVSSQQLPLSPTGDLCPTIGNMAFIVVLKIFIFFM